jgi:hypothetical protein
VGARRHERARLHECSEHTDSYSNTKARASTGLIVRTCSVAMLAVKVGILAGFCQRCRVRNKVDLPRRHRLSQVEMCVLWCASVSVSVGVGVSEWKVNCEPNTLMCTVAHCHLPTDECSVVAVIPRSEEG